MIIGIDGNEANVENKVGVNQYAFEVLSHLRKLQDKKETTHTFIIYLKENPRADLPKENKLWKYKVLPGGGKWIVKTLVPHLYKKKEKLAVFFTPSHYAPPFAPVPRVCSIMDLGYLTYTDQFKKYDYWQLKLWSAWSMAVCKKVIAISEATQKDIVKNYPFASKKIKVTLLSGDLSVKNAKVSEKEIKKIKEKYLIGDNYILFLSTLKPSKNIDGLLTAWSKIFKKYPSYKLVIAGKKGWMFDSIFEQVKKLNLDKKVIFTGFVPDEEKPALIQGAKAFVLPSFWEGFGIDIVNAYTLGVPVVVSDRGSIPEVAGKLGVYVDPDSTNSIAKGIQKVLSMSKNDYNKLSKECVSYAKKFSWEKTARETLEVIESIK